MTTPDQLTAEERATLTPEEAALRIAIRTPRSDRTPEQIRLRATWKADLRRSARTIPVPG